MPSTRSSTRDDSSPSKEEATVGSKRKAETTSPKRSRKAAKQTTIEETLAGDSTKNPPQAPTEDAEIKDINGEEITGNHSEEQTKKEAKRNEAANAEDTSEKNGTDVVNPTGANDGGAVQESSQREKKIASNILEKGVVYFFTRNRVGVEDSDSVGDLSRTYFVLRPLPIGTKLSEFL